MSQHHQWTQNYTNRAYMKPNRQNNASLPLYPSSWSTTTQLIAQVVLCFLLLRPMLITCTTSPVEEREPTLILITKFTLGISLLFCYVVQALL